MTGKVQIISAITWATVMIGSSWILKGTEHSGSILNLLIVGYVMHFVLLVKVSGISTKVTANGNDQKARIA